MPGAEEAIDALPEAQIEEFKEAFALFDKVGVCPTHTPRHTPDARAFGCGKRDSLSVAQYAI